MITTDVAKLAYVAGLVDGEGSLVCWKELHRTSPYRLRANPSYRVGLVVKMRTSEPLATVAPWLGETLPAPYRDNRDHALNYTLDIPGPRLVPVLEALQPFLILKREQAEQAMRLLGLRRSFGGRGRRRLATWVLQEMEAIYIFLREAKVAHRIGWSPEAPVLRVVGDDQVNLALGGQR